MADTMTGWPGEPGFDEITATRQWLGKRGIEVGEPSRLLSARVGARLSRRSPGRFRWLAGAAALSILLAVAYGSVGVHGDGIVLGLVCASMEVALWLSYRHRERALGPLPVMDRRSGRPSAFAILGGWYVASFVITFGGGAALAAAIHLTTPAKAYAQGLIAMLGWAALCCAVILIGTLRRPVYAEDTASAAVDTELRVLDSQAAVPGFYAVIILYDRIVGDRVPGEFTGWLIAYAVLAFGTTVIGVWRHHRRPALPPGDYGTPIRPVLDRSF
ncbi:hypothetical protein ACFQ05_21420 [Amycolatopsis umgeniensis]|uniref:Uncharacterized protein n=1 Tax=Amycolatopsis umgeniensis TaxID=336628 RepID=A0A841BI21_9PSEU|nr:hypothetical protein [Amycolatopsis umgeniensis]MBB5858182.1 hypothetical protein [Amycolatopsis umgeniensis]